MKVLKRSSKFKVGIFFFIACLLAINFCGFCIGQTQGVDSGDLIGEIIEQQSDNSRIGAIEDELDKYLDDETKQLIDGYRPGEIANKASTGKLDFNIKEIFANGLKLLLKEVYQNLGILIRTAVLIIICALLKNLQSRFLSEGVSQVAFYVCYIVLVTILLVSFSTAAKLGMGIINNMVDFMYATIPVLITLLISGGNITTGGVFQPVMLLIVEMAATIIKNAFIPLIFFSTILTIVSNISAKVQLTRLASLIKQIATWGLGIVLTGFIAVVSLQGSMGAVVDGVTAKAAKFAISTFIPVVGKTLSDAADTVVGCTLLIKNAAGVATMLGILIICAVPLIKIIALVALYKACGAMLEPISEPGITNCINDVAGSMLYIFAVAAAVAFMFIISVTALISASNLSAMLR